MKTVLQRFVPNYLMRYYAKIKNSNKSAEAIFTEIYKKDYWGKADGAEYFSGTGTHDENVLKYIDAVVGLIGTNNIKSVFEIGCGDFSITKQVLNQVDVEYTGADVVADLVLHLQKKYGNEKANFIHFDAIIAQNYPDADLCIIRQVLQHLSNSQISQILKKTRKSKYIIVTEHVPVEPREINGDKTLGGYIRLQNNKTSGVFLGETPFNLDCETILSYAKNDLDCDGNIIPALMVSSLLTNN